MKNEVNKFNEAIDELMNGLVKKQFVTVNH